MADIQNKELVAEKLGRWRTHDLRWIESVSFTASSTLSPSTLEITAVFQKHDRGVASGPNFRVILRFEGVSDFRIKSLGPTPKQMIGFFIRDVAERQWEHAKFIVGDDEDGGLSFYCKAASVVSCERI